LNPQTQVYVSHTHKISSSLFTWLSLLLFFIFHFLVWSRLYYLQTLFFAQPFEIKYYHETWDILLFQGFSDLYLFLCFIFSFSILGLNLKNRKNLTSTYISIQNIRRLCKQKTAVVLKIDEKGQPLSAAGYSNKCFSIFPGNELAVSEIF
jgi:signal transduction histidine kinase